MNTFVLSLQKLIMCYVCLVVYVIWLTEYKSYFSSIFLNMPFTIKGVIGDRKNFLAPKQSAAVGGKLEEINEILTF